MKTPRPVRRPEEFYQVFLGGVDTDYMTTTFPGYTGCLRGLSVGGKLLDLTAKGADGIAHGKLERYTLFCYLSHERRRCYRCCCCCEKKTNPPVYACFLPIPIEIDANPDARESVPVGSIVVAPTWMARTPGRRSHDTGYDEHDDHDSTGKPF